MTKYHKIQSVFKRDPATKYKTFLPEYSMPEFEYLKDNTWIWTEKIDGTNMRVIWRGSDLLHYLGIKGRTDKAQIPPFLMKRMEALFPAELMLDTFPETDLVLYGEGFGPKIQKGGGNYGASVDFILFDVNVGGMWLERANVEDIAQQLGIKVVPVLGYGTLENAIRWTRNGFYSSFSTEDNKFFAEGLVLRPEVEMLTRRGERIITKVKYRDFPNG